MSCGSPMCTPLPLETLPRCVVREEGMQEGVLVRPQCLFNHSAASMALLALLLLAGHVLPHHLHAAVKNKKTMWRCS